MSDFSLTEVRSEGMPVLVLGGRLDAGAVSRFKEHIRVLAREGKVNVVLDMAGISFIDSSGLGALVASLQALRAVNGSLALAGLAEKVRMVLELIKLHKVLDIYPDAAAAVRALRDGAESP